MSEHRITAGGKELTVNVTKHARYNNMFVAQCADPDVASQGMSEESALANITEALELLFAEPPAAPEAPVETPPEG